MQFILKMMFLLLSLILEAIWIVTYPILYVVLTINHGLERLGIDYPNDKYDILVHAASVGEINGVKPLLLNLLQNYPGSRILLTVNTSTGRKTGSALHENIQCRLAPLDLLHLRLWQLRITQPKLIVVAETEIWPGLLFAAGIKSIPVVFVNARISAKTIKGYKTFKPLLDWLSKTVKLICTQSEKDASGYKELFQTAIVTCGNLKYAAQLPVFDRGEQRLAWGYSENDLIVTFGSSRPGEEALILSCLDELKSEFPELKLIIAPRHLNRMDEIRSLLQGREASYYSIPGSKLQIHIIDELGHLLPAYAMADIAIIGGSYYPFGGHNPLEAAFYGKVIMMGEFHQSCLDSVKKLQAKQSIIINDVQSLCRDIRKVLLSPEKYLDFGTRAKEVMAEQSHSLDLHLEQMHPYLR